MELNFGMRGRIELNDCTIIHRNFEGRGSKFNREGERNFSVVIPTEEMAEALAKDGWNVKVKDPRDEGDVPFMYLPVKVKFNDWGPNIYLQTGRHRRMLDEETAAILDRISIGAVYMDLRPYDWVVQGKEGRTAYLQSMKVIQDIDRFAEEFEEEE